MDAAKLGLRCGPRLATLMLVAGLGACEAPTNGAVASHELLEMGADQVVLGMSMFMSTNSI